jgi:hypothetical protein
MRVLLGRSMMRWEWTWFREMVHALCIAQIVECNMTINT